MTLDSEANYIWQTSTELPTQWVLDPELFVSPLDLQCGGSPGDCPASLPLHPLTADFRHEWRGLGHRRLVRRPQTPVYCPRPGEHPGNGHWTSWLFHVPPCSPEHNGQSRLDLLSRLWVFGVKGPLLRLSAGGGGQKGPGQTHLCWNLMPCLLWRAASMWDCSLTGERSICAGLFFLPLSGSRTSTVCPTIQAVTMSRTWCPGLIML